jgi:hypothetical protein
MKSIIKFSKTVYYLAEKAAGVLSAILFSLLGGSVVLTYASAAILIASSTRVDGNSLMVSIVSVAAAYTLVAVLCKHLHWKVWLTNLPLAAISTSAMIYLYADRQFIASDALQSLLDAGIVFFVFWLAAAVSVGSYSFWLGLSSYKNKARITESLEK